MHITATREAILSATAPLMAVAQRGMKLGGTGVSLRASKNRLLQMTTCDGSAKISTLTEVSILREGAIGVSAKRLSDIVKSFHSGAQLEFDSQGESLVISSGRSRYRINCSDAAVPDTLDNARADASAGEFTCDAAEFLYQLSFAAHGLGGLGDNTRLPQGVLLHLTGQRLRLVGTNGNRMAVASMEAGAGQAAKLLLGVNTVADLKGILSKSAPDDRLVLRWKNGLVHGTAGTTEYHASMLDGTYVDYERVIAASQLQPFHIGLDDLRGLVQRMLIVSSTLTVRLEGRTLSIATEVSEGKKKGEECVESIELPADANAIPAFEVAVNGQYLSEALAALRGEPVHLSYGGQTGPLTVLSANGEARAYVMPIRT